ncbi:MAG: hypothetical protein KJO85_04440, partial [Gammaproteobacteria bacterium]|nr:hypothetical protein [Gammaproteobacteria bacterium]
MDFSIKKVLLTVAVLMTIVSSNLVAKGGYVELPGDFDDSSNNITNPWWPQPSGQTQVFLEEADDECVVGVVQVIATANQSRATVDGIKVREIWDREYIDNSPESCDGNLGDSGDWELTESTFDWYAEDIHGNVWYYGERSVATDHD